MKKNLNDLRLDSLPSRDFSAESLKLLASRANIHDPLSASSEFDANSTMKDVAEFDHHLLGLVVIDEEVAAPGSAGEISLALLNQVESPSANLMEGVDEGINHDTVSSINSRNSEFIQDQIPPTSTNNERFNMIKKEKTEVSPSSNPKRKVNRKKAKVEAKKKLNKKILLERILKIQSRNKEKIDALRNLLKIIFLKGSKGAQKVESDPDINSLVSKIRQASKDDESLLDILLCFIENASEILPKNPTDEEIEELIRNSQPVERDSRKDEGQKRIFTKNSTVLYQKFKNPGSGKGIQFISRKEALETLKGLKVIGENEKGISKKNAIHLIANRYKLVGKTAAKKKGGRVEVMGLIFCSDKKNGLDNIAVRELLKNELLFKEFFHKDLIEQLDEELEKQTVSDIDTNIITKLGSGPSISNEKEEKKRERSFKLPWSFRDLEKAKFDYFYKFADRALTESRLIIKSKKSFASRRGFVELIKKRVRYLVKRCPALEQKDHVKEILKLRVPVPN